MHHADRPSWGSSGSLHVILAINVRLKSLVGKRQTQHVFCTGLAVTVVGQPIENAPFAEGISGAASLRV